MSLEGLHLTRVRCHWRVYYTYEISFSKQKLHKTLQTLSKLSGADDRNGFLDVIGYTRRIWVFRRCAVRVPVRRHAVRVAGYTGP